MEVLIPSVQEHEFIHMGIRGAARRGDSYRAGKWVKVALSICLEGYQVQFSGWLLHTMKLAAFRNQLVDLYEYHAGLAMLKGSDGVLVLKADYSEAGLIAWQGWTVWPITDGHTLYFRFDAALASLYPLIVQLDAVIEKYHTHNEYSTKE
jgi:hypothetical protein